MDARMELLGMLDWSAECRRRADKLYEKHKWALEKTKRELPRIYHFDYSLIRAGQKIYESLEGVAQSYFIRCMYPGEKIPTGNLNYRRIPIKLDETLSPKELIAEPKRRQS